MAVHRWYNYSAYSLRWRIDCGFFIVLIAEMLINQSVKYQDIQQPLLLGLVTLLKPETISKSKVKSGVFIIITIMQCIVMFVCY